MQTIEIETATVPANEAVVAAGTTVQVVTFHPFERTKILMVHNLLEDIVPDIPMYGGRPKPAGFGNGGGGMEDDELEHLKEVNPAHPILLNDTLSDEEKKIAACGLREVTDESGYIDIEIMIPDGQLKLNEYFFRNGHRVVTVWGEVKSLAVVPIRERNEVDIAEWFDLAEPFSVAFGGQNWGAGPTRDKLPYWSHVRRDLLSISKIDRYLRQHKQAKQCIGRLIHPSWRLVFPVGAGDGRFPSRGFGIHPRVWYELMEEMIRRKLEMVDSDILYHLFRDEIERIRGYEKLRSEKQEEEVEIDFETNAKIIREEDEEWRIWMEKELGLNQG